MAFIVTEVQQEITIGPEYTAELVVGVVPSVV
jgi:hypothetical protein